MRFFLTCLVWDVGCKELGFWIGTWLNSEVKAWTAVVLFVISTILAMNAFRTWQQGGK
jgi:hypothetical protein